MNQVTYQKINPNNWIDFETLFAKHKGVRGGCWCSYYLNFASEHNKLNREERKSSHERLVASGIATGIMLYDKNLPIAWCQVAPKDVIKRFNRNRIYEAKLLNSEDTNIWRISCVFVDKDCRRRGIAKKAIAFALDYIKQEGGGVVEVFPFLIHDNPHAFHFNGSVAFYESLGFERIMPVGKYDICMRKEI